MKLGSFEVPEKRLVPDAIIDIRKIYDAIQSDEIASKDLASMLGYKYATATPFYARLNSMLNYGLLEGRGTFRVSEVGKSIAYPENEMQEKLLKTKAILNVSLWKELYQKLKKSPPVENFWVQIKNITGVEPQEAQRAEKQVRKWYVEDVAQISEEVLEQKLTQESKGLSSFDDNTKSMSQQLVSTDQEKLEFGRSVLLLPKKDLKKEWEKLQKYMTIYLEDYREPPIISEEPPQE